MTEEFRDATRKQGFTDCMNGIIQPTAQPDYLDGYAEALLYRERQKLAEVAQQMAPKAYRA